MNPIAEIDIKVALGVKDFGSVKPSEGTSVVHGFQEIPAQKERMQNCSDPLEYGWRSRFGEYFPFKFGQLKGGITEWDPTTGLLYVFGSSVQSLEKAILIETPGLSQVRQGRFIHLLDYQGERLAEIELCTASSTQVSTIAAGDITDGVSTVAYALDEGCEFEHTLRVRTSNFTVNDRSLGLVQKAEIFDAEIPVRFLKVEGSSSEIAFVFSAMSTVGDLTFNYKSSLKDFSGTQYYILDDAREQGSYYLCENRNFKIAKSVQSFVRHILAEEEIHSKDIYFFGSSKGATAAAWHGLAAGVGNIVIAAPQFLIGDFLKVPHPGILNYMAGGRSQDDIDWLNKAFERTVDASLFRGKVRIMVGDQDPHRETHVPALVNFLERSGVDVKTLPVMGANHSETGLVYASMLRTFASQDDKGTRAFYAVSRVGNALRLTVSPASPEAHLAVRVHHGNEQYAMEWYSPAHTWQWDDFPAGSVVFRIYEKRIGETEPYFAYTTKRLQTNVVESRKY